MGCSQLFRFELAGFFSNSNPHVSSLDKLMILLGLTILGILEISVMVVNGYNDLEIYLTLMATGAILGYVKGKFFRD